MAPSLSNVSQYWADSLAWVYREAKGVPQATNGRKRRKISTDELDAFYADKPVRMTPWGPQYKIDFKGWEWFPPMPNNQLSKPLICGKWIGDSPYRRLDKPIEFSSVEHTGALFAFRNGEITDPSIELAKKHASEGSVPLTKACKITDLPTELLQKILSLLVPSGCAFQFFPCRLEEETTMYSCVQKFVPEPRHHAGISMAEFHTTTKETPQTGTTHLAVAATCRRLQDEAYSIFYGQNAFLFHLTASIVKNGTLAKSLSMHSWSRIVPRRASESGVTSTGLGPLTSLAAAYLERVVLVPSLPPRGPTARELALVTDLVTRVSASLQDMKLKSLTIDFQQPRMCFVHHRERSRKYIGDEFPDMILQLDSLGVKDVEGCGLVIRPREPEVIIVDESDEGQEVLLPLLGEGGMAKELVLSGCMSGGLKAGLQERFGKR
ncbi:unnamed protein product [Zymoseptoria tritici ST99CH_1A5]|uniref:F-box domain-containing protein n=1 Tax=Zymoseptoria tritici ST99CH_1A5 TaxID=1276529 RepID=A0A1Y6LYI2_ZYMTR|nr:unnamed protein product [Zymoseptoria tritici ST99CH_1A5]